MRPIAGGLIGLVAGAAIGAVYGYYDFEKEPAPILSRAWVSCIGAGLIAPVGLLVGIVVGSFLKSPKGTDQHRENTK
jgi:hypothetical protein